MTDRKKKAREGAKNQPIGVLPDGELNVVVDGRAKADLRVIGESGDEDDESDDFSDLDDDE